MVRLGGPRCEEIQEEVAHLIEDFGISHYPFNIWELLNKLRIGVVSYSKLPVKLAAHMRAIGLDAITIRPENFDSTRTVIYYDDAPSIPRQRIRFTLAHEVGHLILQHPGTGDEVYEAEAHNFARYLLAPDPLVIRDSKFVPEIIQCDFDISYSCARVVCERSANRKRWGSSDLTDYERAILGCCTLGGGGQVACA